MFTFETSDERHGAAAAAATTTAVAAAATATATAVHSSIMWRRHVIEHIL